MIKRQKVIAGKNLPSRPPTILTIATVALLKSYEAPSVVWAVVVTLLVIIWIIGITALFLEDTVELSELK